MKKRTKLPTTCFECRDCKRAIGWCKDTKDPKGSRCYDCNVIYRRKANGGKP